MVINLKYLFVILSLSAALPANAHAGDPDAGVGRTSVPEHRTWKDDSTGYEITQWTSIGSNHHPYFTVDPFINDSTVVIFSDRSGSEQLYRLDLRSGVMTQMTNAGRVGKIDHLPRFRKLWFMDGSVLFEMDTRTFRSRRIYDFHETFTPIDISVTADAKYLVFSADQSRGRSGTRAYGPFALYRLDLNDTTVTKITPDLGFNISHVQTNPADPNLVLYCWQWEAPGREKLVGAAPIRVWWVNIQGTDGGPFKQPFGFHRTHEAWTPDGKFMTYAGNFRFGPQTGREVLGIQSIDGTTDLMYDAMVWHAHQTMFSDNIHWTADLFNHDDRYLMLFKRTNEKKLEPTVLFRHASSWAGQSSHPHPRFSPDGRCIIFSTDRTGTPQVYTVRVDIPRGHHAPIE
jgi:oligogalacturonide lyase